MNIFISSVSTETNTFATTPTGPGSFTIESFSSIEQLPSDHIWRKTIENLSAAGGHQVSLGPFAEAQPCGITSRSVYENIKAELLSSLADAMPVDAVILLLHGAMVAEGYPDCEGDIIASVRELVGKDIPIGVELDLHCHYTAKMHENADIIIAYKEYPHTDPLDRFKELWALTVQQTKGDITPTTSVIDCKMVNFWHTTKEPMYSFVRHMEALERHREILSVNFGQGFPYGDVPEAGAKIWVVTDNNPKLGEQVCLSLRNQIWQMREQTVSKVASITDAMARLRAHQQDGDHHKPIIIADIADNPGGGAPSDSNFILEQLLNYDIGNVALGPYWDVGAITTCVEAGEGATLTLRLGGKCGPASGSPIDLKVTVKAIRSDHLQSIPEIASFNCGLSVWLQTESMLDIVLISNRQQAYARNIFSGLGIELENKLAVVVKSSQHFYADFAPIAADVLYVNSPGLLRTDFENIPYKHRDLTFWPRVDNPYPDDTDLQTTGQYQALLAKGVENEALY